jgi:hypothetical protein
LVGNFAGLLFAARAPSDRRSVAPTPFTTYHHAHGAPDSIADVSTDADANAHRVSNSIADASTDAIANVSAHRVSDPIADVSTDAVSDVNAH